LQHLSDSGQLPGEPAVTKLSWYRLSDICGICCSSWSHC